MRSNLLRRSLLSSAVLACFAAVGSPTLAMAQDAATAPADTRDDDNRFNPGIFGLIGLAGLLGLRRRDNQGLRQGEVNRPATSRV